MAAFVLGEFWLLHRRFATLCLRAVAGEQGILKSDAELAVCPPRSCESPWRPSWKRRLRAKRRGK